MIKICFVCHGNICRSPMAEFIMKEKVKTLGLSDKFLIESRATSYEEDGNDMYPQAKKKLDEMRIPYMRHKATRLEKTDYQKFDYFICMEKVNMKNSRYIFDDSLGKVRMLLPKDIADPWYSGNFDETYSDLDVGIDKLIEELRKQF